MFIIPLTLTWYIWSSAVKFTHVLWIKIIKVEWTLRESDRESLKTEGPSVRTADDDVIDWGTITEVGVRVRVREMDGRIGVTDLKGQTRWTLRKAKWCDLKWLEALYCSKHNQSLLCVGNVCSYDDRQGGQANKLLRICTFVLLFTRHVVKAFHWSRLHPKSCILY